MTDILQAILLGIIEGFTEFLPISSTGHILISQDLIGFKDTAQIFTVVVQLGALGAVLWFYKKDIYQKIIGLLARDKKALNFWKNWILATIPAGLIGLVVVKSGLEIVDSLLVIAVALIVGGIAMWVIETRLEARLVSKKSAQLDKLTTKQALQVGCYQILALIPGVSRSGSTIMGGLLSGLDRVAATEFSFYLSIPILMLAGLYKLLKGYNDLSTISGGGVALLAGTIASFITAFLVIGWLLKYVSKHNFKPFAYYRIVLGIILLLAINL